jgi:quinoprotein glucose dehydrogenase
MNGHAFIQTFIEIDDEIYPNMNPQYGLISRQFFRCKPGDQYVRHDLRIWEAARGAPNVKDANGHILLGDDVVKDWRSRAKRGIARVRAYYDVHPTENSELTLDASTKNKWGDPMPKIVHRRDAATEARYAATKQHIQGIFELLASNHNGKILRGNEGNYLDHPAGGCRMGTDPAASVCDNYGRTHDHENLFVVGAPTQPTAGCTNGTLTFVALTLRSAGEIAKNSRA